MGKTGTRGVNLYTFRPTREKNGDRRVHAALFLKEVEMVFS